VGYEELAACGGDHRVVRAKRGKQIRGQAHRLAERLYKKLMVHLRNERYQKRSLQTLLSQQLKLEEEEHRMNVIT
jgi:hypothetical protein